MIAFCHCFITEYGVSDQNFGWILIQTPFINELATFRKKTLVLSWLVCLVTESG